MYRNVWFKLFLQEKEVVLFLGYKTMELTEEQLERRQQRAKKRRLQAHEKREKDKVRAHEKSSVVLYENKRIGAYDAGPWIHPSDLIHGCSRNSLSTLHTASNIWSDTDVKSGSWLQTHWKIVKMWS